ncbi:MAG TPA: 2-C-methyl-D-erythritol 2,4-cyclodiphosphate synthase [Actinomycetota bacterium]|nr:2-C-methyl-D-erythritol 2,4-cyclodiphosphate synthase [Actinomycetota bacterium]
MRVGHGFDAHPFDDARALVLGGVPIEGTPGLSGHSDADVLAHAVADALLGAGGLGDLGDRFPPDDRWAEASSLGILAEVARLLGEARWAIANVDATVIAQRPRLAPYRERMEEALAGALSIVPERVSVKATTTDGMGFAGRGEGIAALAVALVERI